MPKRPTGGAIKLTPGEGRFPRLSKSQAAEIARGLSTRGDVIEHVAGEAEVSGVPRDSKKFETRVRLIMRAFAKLNKPTKPGKLPVKPPGKPPGKAPGKPPGKAVGKKRTTMSVKEAARILATHGSAGKASGKVSASVREAARVLATHGARKPKKQ